MDSDSASTSSSTMTTMAFELAEQDVPSFSVGERFKTFEEFDIKLNRRLLFTQEKVVKARSSKTIQWYNARNLQKKFRDDLKYKLLNYRCKHGGTFASRGTERKTK